MAVSSCRVKVKPTPSPITEPLKQAVKQQHEVSAEALAKAREALQKIAATLLSNVSAEQIAGYVQQGVDPAAFLESIVAKKQAAGYGRLTDAEIEKRKALLKSFNPASDIYDTEIAMGQLIAKLPEKHAKHHKAILRNETRFDPAVVRCRWDDRITGRNTRCNSGMMGMGQISKEWHTDVVNLASNPGGYITGQLEAVLEMNVEVSARFFYWLVKRKGLRQGVRSYNGSKIPSKLDSYEAEFLKGLDVLFGLPQPW